jgi:hypothetical protein
MPDELPRHCAMSNFLVPPEQVIASPLPAPWEWVRLTLPLYLSGQFVGVWLFGRRDPDDLYGHTETAMLQNIQSHGVEKMDTMTNQPMCYNRPSIPDCENEGHA